MPSPTLNPTVYVGAAVARARAAAKPTRQEIARRAAIVNYRGTPIKLGWGKVGITQRELGHRIGLSGNDAGADISRIESGSQQPRLEKLMRIADALGVSLESLLPV